VILVINIMIMYMYKYGHQHSGSLLSSPPIPPPPLTHPPTHPLPQSNRDIPISKLEKLFEAETLSERDSYDVGSDDSTQAPALERLRGSMKIKRESEKVRQRDQWCS